MTGAWLRLGLRARLLLVGVLGVAVALAIGSIALYGVLTVVSFRALDSSAAATAKDVADLVDRGRLPDPIPVTGSQIVQVVDGRDRVVSASVNADRLTAILLPQEIAQALAGAHPNISGSRVGVDSPLRVTAIEAGPSDARRAVVVAQGYADIQHSQRTLRLTLLATYPLLLAVLAAIAWRVVGAALRPVEALRSAAERISGAGQDARLPVPTAHDEVHALAVTLNSMLERLEASRSQQRAFVADAAHELRSPLASMQTQLEVATRLGEAGQATADLRAEVTRMITLVEDLLLLARADESTPRERDTGPVELSTLLAELAEGYAGARVRVTTSLTSEAAVLGDPGELRRVVANLLDNAVRHAATRVTLALESPTDGSLADFVDVTVRDDGSGIAPEDRARVFERFTRLDAARDRDAGGSGLGLAIVHELVQHAGGTVRLESPVEGGLLVRVTLPVAPQPAKREERA